MPQPKGMVFRLNRALYGLKKAPHAWNEKIDAFFRKTSFSCLVANPQLYIQSVDGLVIVIVMDVDELSIIGNHSIGHRLYQAKVTKGV